MMVGEDRIPGGSARASAQRAVELMDVLLRERPTVELVTDVLVTHGEKEPLGLTDADVTALRDAAHELRAVFAAAGVAEAAAVLNDLLAASAAPPRLTSHGGEHPWHLHIDADDDGPWGQWLVTSSCLAFAVLLADRQRPPGGLCASPSCGRPFVDLGGGSPRRYCSTRCATRERVAAHRKRA
ncbi:CGNR zinc finger domain-containing protein [Saccharomonospora sp. NPDC006951]